MEIVQKNTKKRKHKPKAKKLAKPTATEAAAGVAAKKVKAKTVVKNQKTVSQAVGSAQSKVTESDTPKNTKKSKKYKKAALRHSTKYVEFVRVPAGNDSKSDNNNSENTTAKSQTGKVTNCDAEKRKRKSKHRKGAKPKDSHMKVQTHAALYRNPQEFSSNWKKLFQEIGTGKKTTTPKRKATQDESSPPAKRRKGVGKIGTKSNKVPENPPEKKPEVWFDDVDEDLLDLEVQTSTESNPSNAKTKKADAQVESTPESNTKKEDTSSKLVKERSFEGLTKAVAMDCEMVGVGSGGEDSVLARVSVVNQFGKCIYDKYVKPREQVTDYRTQFSGIRPEDLKNAEDFSSVQKDVYEIIKGRILVGHALNNDLKVLFLDHPHKKIRDTSRYRGFRKLFQGRTPSLKKLTANVLNVKVQEGEHNSVEDAQAAMRLYTMYKVQWEKEIKLKHNKKLLKPVVQTDNSP